MDEPTPKPTFEEVFAAWRNLPPSGESLEDGPQPYVDVPDQKPACWYWPIPPDILERGRAINDIPSDDDSARHDEAFTVLTEWQRDRCAVCGDHSDRLAVDHDHETGLIRGLLCRSCNRHEASRGRNDQSLKDASPPPGGHQGAMVCADHWGLPCAADTLVAESLTFDGRTHWHSRGNWQIGKTPPKVVAPRFGPESV